MPAVVPQDEKRKRNINQLIDGTMHGKGQPHLRSCFERRGSNLSNILK